MFQPHRGARSTRGPRVTAGSLAVAQSPREQPPLPRPRFRTACMKTLAKKLLQFIADEQGPTAVEYAVMLALIVIVCLAAITSVGSNASTTFNKVSKSL